MHVAHHMLTWTDWARTQEEPLSVPAMLQEIAEAGYAGVELIDGPAVLGPATELKGLLDDAGLQIAAYSSFVTPNEWEPNTTQYRADMDYAAELGISTIMVCGGWLNEPRRRAFDEDYREFAENLARAQEYAKQYGQVVAFHPHMGCMVETNEEVELLLAHAPDLHLCIDTGHLAGVRSDPAALVRTHPERIAHVHLKDWSPSQHTFTELGRGDAGLDFADFLAALTEAHYGGWLSVERDGPQVAPRESAQISARFLESLTGMQA